MSRSQAALIASAYHRSVAVSSDRNLRLRLEWFGLQTMLQRRMPLLRGNFDVSLTGRVDRIGVPPERGSLFRSKSPLEARMVWPPDNASTPDAPSSRQLRCLAHRPR